MQCIPQEKLLVYYNIAQCNEVWSQELHCYRLLRDEKCLSFLRLKNSCFYLVCSVRIVSGPIFTIFY